MASNLLLNKEVQRWLELHNVSLDPVFPDSGGSYSWPQQVSDAADLLKHSAENAVRTIKGLVSTLEGPENERWVDDPASSVLSACAAFPELSKSGSHLPLRETLLWTIVEGVVPGTRVFYQAKFALPRCDTGDEEVDQRGGPLYGSSTLLCMKEYGPSESVDYDDDSVDFIWRGGYDDLSDLESASSDGGNGWRLPPDPGDEADDSEAEEDDDDAEEDDDDAEEDDDDAEEDDDEVKEDDSEVKEDDSEVKEDDDEVEEDDDEAEEDDDEVEEDDSEVKEDDGEVEEDAHHCRQMPDDFLGQGNSISGQHLTPSTFHPSPLVPVLCIADEVNIVPLLSSALLQRRELEIIEPVVGILLPAIGSECQVLFGWMEENTDGIHALPRIHIVYSDGSNPSVPGGGIFDLQHRSDLVNLVTYLADLGNQQLFNVPSPLSLSPNANSFIIPSQWRADEHLANRKDHDYSTQRIWIWLHSIPDPRTTTSSENAPDSGSGLAPRSTGCERVAQMDLDVQDSRSNSRDMSFAAKSCNKLKIQEKTRDGQRQASVADWLWDHRAFVIGYDDPGRVETIYLNADFKAYLKHTKGLAMLVQMPCEAGIDLMMTKLAHNLLLMVQNLKLESKEEEEHKEESANPLADQLNNHIDAVDKKLQEALGMSQTNQGLTSESLTLATPHVVYILNNFHKSILAMYNKQNVSKAEWRLPWDTIHNLIWLQRRLERYCTQVPSAEQPNYFVFPKATLKCMRCEELDYSSMRVEAMLPALESESASPVPAIPKTRSHQKNRLVPEAAETQNYLQARYKPQFSRIATILTLHDIALITLHSATERARSEIKEAAELSLAALTAVTGLENHQNLPKLLNALMALSTLRALTPQPPT
ncbi:hypothetical protein L227DRAFT_602770 [Lentinus tigrinus ALCF2SS1-6]|uniref:Uncharacterized protein n=1 Tax=Lentinus tigrinus ALCF2SS1-6 TaxID=1328759 RepID=A0A5C2S1X3_9APHY|nr:hypothetical protein L227DRAFT_602770 [Lentinus tigrinus ALCF2SS1-6]